MKILSFVHVHTIHTIHAVLISHVGNTLELGQLYDSVKKCNSFNKWIV